MKSPVRSKSFTLLLPLLLALPLSAGASPQGPPPEPRCGAIVEKAFVKAGSVILRGSVKDILADCGNTLDPEFTFDLDDRLQKIADQANLAIENLKDTNGFVVGPAGCDPELAPIYPIEIADFYGFCPASLNVCTGAEQYFNEVIEPTCDDLP